MRVVDAHQHFWTLDEQRQPWRTDHHGAIARDFTPDDLVGPAAEVGVTGTVLVQSVDGKDENKRLAQHARHPLVAGVVAWLPLFDPGAAVAEWSRLEPAKLSGVRCLIGEDPMEWLSHPDVVSLMRDLGAAGLCWDVVPVTPDQIEAVVGISTAVPDLRIVIDHLGRPPIDGGDWARWAEQMIKLASCPNVAVKLSVGLDVLSAWEAWDSAALTRPVDHVAEYFGAERCLLSSNWPVVELRAGYAEAWSDLQRAAYGAFTTGPERDLVRGGAASWWYGLEMPAPVEGM